VEQVDGPTPDRVVLVQALSTLPERHRRAVVLYHLAGQSVSEIAQQEQVGDATVRSWLHRGRTALAVALADPKEAHSV
jgi:RNA polymerase sigma-70 factor (ECF subfamily)